MRGRDMIMATKATQLDNNLNSLVKLKNTIESRVIGQHNLIENLLVALLADGHVLI